MTESNREDKMMERNNQTGNKIGYLLDLWKNDNQVQNMRTTVWLFHHADDNIPLLINILRKKKILENI